MKIKREKLIAGILTLLFVASLVTVSIVFQSNLSLKSGLENERLRSESLLSEKLTLNKVIEKVRKEINLLKGKNEELDKLLTDAEMKLLEKQKVIASMSQENASINGLKKQIADIQQIKADLELQIARLQESNNLLMAENANLQSSILALQSQNAGLTTDLNMLRLANADNYQVITTKGKKDKLTVSAAKAKKISVNFEVPQNFTEKISFRITTPDGKTVTEDDKALTWLFPDDSKIMTASLDGGAGEIDVTRSVNMTYRPKEKLKKGTYRVEMLNKGEYIGSCRVKLK